VEVARIAERQLSDGPAAIEALTTLLEADDSDSGALRELGRLYTAAERWSDAAATLEREARLAPSAEDQAALYMRLGSVYDERLSNLDRAADAYRAALDARPDDVETLHALADVHTRREDWLALQEVLTLELRTAHAVAGQIAIFGKLAKVAEERIGSANEAVGFWSQALDLDGENAQVLGELERLLAAAERWHELAEVLERHVALCQKRGQTEEALEKLLALADVWDRHVGSTDAAAEILERVLAASPHHVGALTQLARIYEGASDWTRCREVLARAAELKPTGRAAAELYFRMGRLEEIEGEGGSDPAKAEAYFTRAIQNDPSHVDALAALERLARGRQDWKTVVHLLDLRERAEADPGRKRDLAIEIADALRGPLGAPEGAIPYLERALAAQPTDGRVLEALADAQYKSDHLEEAGALYRQMLERFGSKRTKEVGRVQARLGGIAERRGKEAEAVEHYALAFAIDPTHGAAMAALGRLYVRQADWEKARKVFRSMLLQNLDAEVQMTKADIYLELGQIHARLGEIAKARNMYERGLELDAAHAGLRVALGAVTKGT
jgi:tetratricopeptide (TPR) repeat protein